VGRARRWGLGQRRGVGAVDRGSGHGHRDRRSQEAVTVQEALSKARLSVTVTVPSGPVMVLPGAPDPRFEAVGVLIVSRPPVTANVTVVAGSPAACAAARAAGNGRAASGGRCRNRGQRGPGHGRAHAPRCRTAGPAQLAGRLPVNATIFTDNRYRDVIA
jgi:hypothetical protein